MSIIKFRTDPNSPWMEVPAIVGPPGPQGDAPVRGEDYWTENDKQEIVESMEDNFASKSYVETTVGNIEALLKTI